MAKINKTIFKGIGTALITPMTSSGVDYANLGRETAQMVCEILVNGADPAELPVRTFDNGTATINTETCEAIGYDYDELVKIFEPYCTKVQPIQTAENF